MQQENQNIEWKENWRDEYLKWICGFANANGGKLYIGMNDKGVVTGVIDTKKLLEDIPNKIKDILGIIVNVNLKSKNYNKYIEIAVDAYPYPINYKGQYHYRSGSTKQELKGIALDKFLLQKQGKHWDSVPVPKFPIKKLSQSEFVYFKKLATNTNRLSKEIIHENNALLLQNLQLIETKYIKRAAVLLFYNKPEEYVTGAYIKIGFFKTDDDLLFQDEIHGSLFQQVENTMNLLLTKYLKATIDYKGIHRTETFPYPEAALREALLNAIAHKDYSAANPIQISVYKNKIIIYNDGQLPENWTVEQLLKKHPSKPFNPLISNVFFHSGLIEAWGRGTLKIMNECKKLGLPIPNFTNEFGGFVVEFRAHNVTKNVTNNVTNNVTINVTNNVTKNDKLIIQILTSNNHITIEELSIKLGKNKRTILRNLEKLKLSNLIQRVGPTNGGHWQIINNAKK